MIRKQQMIDALYASAVEIEIPPPKACACGKTPEQTSFDYHRGAMGMYLCACGVWVPPNFGGEP